MAVPKYYEFLPFIIRFLGDGKVHTTKELSEYCALAFDLSDTDKTETLSSGQNKLFNRIGWARTYLKMAGLIRSPERAHFCLTDD